VSGPISLMLRVSGVELDGAQIAGITRNLRGELLVLDVDDVRSASAGPAPAGAKGAEAIAAGALLVSMAPQLVGAVVDVITSWLRRQPIDIEIEIEGQRLRGSVTRAQRDAIVTAYLRRMEK
jgi:hypothetical protein